MFNLFYAADFVRYSAFQDQTQTFLKLAGVKTLTTTTKEIPSLLPSRYDIAWNATPRVRLPPLRESGHRVLFSTISSFGTDGLGHMMAVMNAEIRTALLFGLTYSHRVSSYGHLTEGAPLRIEDMFGWGGGEISRLHIYRNICGGKGDEMGRDGWRNESVSGRTNLKRPCLQCQNIVRYERTNSEATTGRLQGMRVNRIVNIPHDASYNWCNPIEDPNLSSRNCEAVRKFKKAHANTRHALFQMGAEVCDNIPASSDFRITRGWFYWKYWGRHSLHQKKEHLEGDHVQKRSRAILRFSDNELVIAVHVRRGDFLLAQNSARKAISCDAFAVAIVGVLRVVREVGGKFANLQPHVYVYSEGQPMKGAKGVVGHDLKKMNKAFVDEKGIVRGGPWMQELIGNLAKPEGLPIPRVTMRISTDTVEALHEMASADWFLGSMSGLSTNVVGSIGRGVLLQPNSACGKHLHMRLCFHPDTGVVMPEHIRVRWAEYSRFFENYLAPW